MKDGLHPQRFMLSGESVRISLTPQYLIGLTGAGRGASTVTVRSRWLIEAMVRVELLAGKVTVLLRQLPRECGSTAAPP